MSRSLLTLALCTVFFTGCDPNTQLLLEHLREVYGNVPDPGESVDDPSVKISLVSGSNASPTSDKTVAIGSTDVVGLVFKLEALRDPTKVTTLSLAVNGAVSVGDIVNLRLYRDGDGAPFAVASQMSEKNGVLVYTWTSLRNLLPDTIALGSPVTIRCIYSVGRSGVAHLGDNYRFKLTQLTTLNSKSEVLAVAGSAAAVGSTIIVPFDVYISADAPTGNQTQAIVAGTQLGRFKITNLGTSKVDIRRVKVTDGGTHGATTCSLYYSDQNSSNYTGYLLAKGINCASGIDWSGATFAIDGGAYRYLTVAISSIGGAVAGDTFQLSVAKLGDVTYEVRETDLGYDGNGDGSLLGMLVNLPVVGKPSLATLTKQ